MGEGEYGDGMMAERTGAEFGKKKNGKGKLGNVNNGKKLGQGKLGN